MIKVAIYRNDPYGEALSVMLNETEGFNVIGTFNDSKPVESNHMHVTPDVVLLDLLNPLSKTVNNIQQLKSRNEATKVIMLTDALDKDSIFSCVRAGADGYLLRKTSLTMLRDFIVEAYSGGFPMSPIVARQLMDTFSPQSPISNSEKEALTVREMEVLKLLVDGMTYKLIASELNIAIDTVRSHIKNIYEKMNVNSKSEAVAKALRQHYF